MYIPDFKYHRPKTIKEASSILLQSSNAAPIAGGTDLLVEIKTGLRQFHDIVSLSEIDELKQISENSVYVFIGSAITHTDIMKSDLVREKHPALAEAASKIGSHQIRNSGTIGGNLCTGASCADTAPILMAYDASVELVSEAGIRIVNIKDFLIHHHQTDVKKGEILTKVIVPKRKRITGACFEKFGLREAASISVASSAVVLSFENNKCTNAGIVIGACGPTPVFSNKASNIILGKSAKDIYNNNDIIESVANAASEDSLPIDDIRGSADYRRELIKVLTKRAIQNAVKRTGLV
jgi:carbon-monoxide dehydrogenase medium subunit